MLIDSVMDDGQLLQEYVVNHSEAAFRALVERYIRLVYGAALRQLGNPSQAEDVTQAVFVILARKAPALSTETILSGWLYRATRFTADKARRTEYRRQQREQEAFQMQTSVNDSDWSRLAPVLDDAMAQLHDGDRTAILLRFFENKSLRDIGLALGVSEDNAQKRVSRAIVKLRGLLVKEGVTVSSAALTAGISTCAVPIVPAPVMATVAAAGPGHSVPVAIEILVRSVRFGWSWPKVIASSSVACVILATTLIVTRSFLHRHPPPDEIAPGVARLQVKLNGKSQGITNQSPALGVAPATGNSGMADIRLDLTGTPGLRFEVAYSHDSVTRTTNGVLPAEVSFQADAFDASIKLHDPGQLGFAIYRNNQIRATSPPSDLSTDRTYMVEFRAGRGFRLSME